MLKLKTDVVRGKIEETGYSASQFAKRYGFPQTTLASWLTGARNPKRETIMRLADVLRCDPGEISYIELRVNVKKLDADEALFDELRNLVMRLSPGQQKAVLQLVRTMAEANEAAEGEK